MIVAVDHPCWKCRYNVRGLSEGGNCPECGVAIDLSRHPRQGEIAKVAETFAIVVLVLLLLVIIFLDLAFGASAHWPFAQIAWVFVAAVAVPAWLIRRRRAVGWMFIIASALLFALPYIPHTRVKSYGQFYAGIKPGMTRAAVLARLDDYYPNRGNTQIPTIRYDNATKLSMTLGGNGMPLNAEAIVIRFSGNLVISKSYTRD